jgi:hypothetical protein
MRFKKVHFKIPDFIFPSEKCIKTLQKCPFFIINISCCSKLAEMKKLYLYGHVAGLHSHTERVGLYVRGQYIISVSLHWTPVVDTRDIFTWLQRYRTFQIEIPCIEQDSLPCRIMK